MHFEIVHGVPAKHKGWISISGNKLNFDINGFAKDDIDNTMYKLENNNVILIS